MFSLETSRILVLIATCNPWIWRACCCGRCNSRNVHSNWKRGHQIDNCGGMLHVHVIGVAQMMVMIFQLINRDGTREGWWGGVSYPPRPFSFAGNHKLHTEGKNITHVHECAAF